MKTAGYEAPGVGQQGSVRDASGWTCEASRVGFRLPRYVEFSTRLARCDLMLLVRCLLLLSVAMALLPAEAVGDRLLRGGSGGRIAVVDQRGGKVWLGSDSGASTVVTYPGGWILDVAFVGDAAYIARGEPREGPVRLSRHSERSTTETIVPDSSAMSDARLLVIRDQLWLFTAEGVWRRPAGRSQRIAGWDFDSYAFYAASIAPTPQGFKVLWPTFNTCQSADRLEGYRTFHVTRAGDVRHADQGIETARWLAADGRTYVDTTTTAGRCSLAMEVGGTRRHVLDVLAPWCDWQLEHNGRFTVVVLDRQVYRLHEGVATRLRGRLPGNSRLEAFQPDHRGRALVLFADGTVMRFSSKAAPMPVAHVAF